ncbi:flagellin N-terminal helical domain-containing protein [Vampirovibrio chlorellavorus]|uniref:flagellin N-terminal helical domain-containing protein n=1 Tax=Vampirovibrio chlorellavorus TaxID=758823 RepID=UPI0026EE3CEB|nr:flagellin [Vampirovibrio chlorellavorus]
MPLVVNTNVSSINAQRYLTNNTAALGKTMEKLASGYRINRAGDDAAGLQVSEKLRAQIRGSQKALDNVQDGINLLNIADGAYQSITDAVQRMRELAVQAANDTYSSAQRSAMQIEYDSLASGIIQMAEAAQFNGINLLDGTDTTSGINLQITANQGGNADDLDVSSALIDVTGIASTISGGLLSGHSAAQSAIALLDTAIDDLNAARGQLGAYTNRLEYTAQNLATNVENTSASESRVRNVDVAAESASLARNQILQQASQAMLAQANQAPQLALQLLRG